MSTAHVGMRGQPPSLLVKPYVPNPERAKYAKLWEDPRYRAVSPGEHWATQFLEVARPERHADIIDFGCGTGRGALALALFGSLKVTMLDFTSNCLDPEVAQACETQPTRINFKLQDLTKPISVNAAYGYCSDVMEHIPTEDVPKVLRNILGSANKVFFGISTVDDHMGAIIGETLHLTVKPMVWWLEQLKAAGATINWTKEGDDFCGIYCSTWHDAADIVTIGRINVPEDIVEAQTKTNIEADWAQVTPHERQDREIVLLAGGPSMRDHFDEIKELRAAGCALVTMNGAYGWAIDRGLVPSAQIVLDAREFNSRFVQPQVATCKYLIASQVHPNTLAGLPKDRTLLWHSGISDANEALVRARHNVYYPVPGGSTVMLRALPLLRLLGYTRFHVFGFDSSVNDTGDHHSYAQPENDNQPLLPVTCGGRTFQCVPWMLSQASETRDLIKFLGDEIELDVRGDGLIAWMIKTGADMAREDRNHA